MPLDTGLPKQPKPLLTKEQLNAIYPTPKTYDEKLAERAEIHAIRRSWLPKHPRWRIAGLVAALLFGLLLIGFTVATLMLTVPMLGVPMVMLTSLLWFYGFRATITTIRTYRDTDFEA
jgi:hypothetical protein